mmetsp:Transcript_147330/g.455779  ORF Transcript_147330/g.455779 Transcript_147330/m.455779 type:complete len:247 (+) Transcript_147330:516-1256(+)
MPRTPRPPPRASPAGGSPRADRRGSSPQRPRTRTRMLSGPDPGSWLRRRPRRVSGRWLRAPTAPATRWPSRCPCSRHRLSGHWRCLNWRQARLQPADGRPGWQLWPLPGPRPPRRRAPAPRRRGWQQPRRQCRGPPGCHRPPSPGPARCPSRPRRPPPGRETRGRWAACRGAWSLPAMRRSGARDPRRGPRSTRRGSNAPRGCPRPGHTPTCNPGRVSRTPCASQHAPASPLRSTSRRLSVQRSHG